MLTSSVLLALTLALAQDQRSVHPGDQLRLLDGKVAADLLVHDIDDLLASRRQSRQAWTKPSSD